MIMSMLQDENGDFRDGTSDGYKAEKMPLSTMNSALDASTSSHDHDDLDALRNTLKELYPWHAGEFDNNGLLFPAKHEYPDTNSNDTFKRAYRQMVRIRQMDTILQNAQRQGRISFYMTCFGEEAIHFGAASALTLQDTVLAQYREQGLLMWRGFTNEQFTNQCFSNDRDLGKGRQMPVHYGSRALNYQTISSPLGTQIPQAAGAAYRLRLAGKKNVAICFFGDGCASTTDFHSGLNFAATLGSPVIFFCRNNGYAISTPVTDQYAGDGIVSRAPGYGVAGIRVDGNDIFAVHAAVREARKYALEHNAPVLIEAMSYRQGHHSTSDDSLRYRSAAEVQSFADKSDPVVRVENFLRRHDRLTDSEARNIQDEEKMAVIDAMRQAERRNKPSLDEMFTDVYHELPQSLKEQQQQLIEDIAKYPNKYK
jgi:2-oxoisovalerate dehydrogenase E1 component alpha subunit